MYLLGQIGCSEPASSDRGRKGPANSHSLMFTEEELGCSQRQTSSQLPHTDVFGFCGGRVGGSIMTHSPRAAHSYLAEVVVIL